jgi:hypothetical protein
LVVTLVLSLWSNKQLMVKSMQTYHSTLCASVHNVNVVGEHCRKRLFCLQYHQSQHSQLCFAHSRIGKDIHIDTCDGHEATMCEGKHNMSVLHRHTQRMWRAFFRARSWHRARRWHRARLHCTPAAAHRSLLPLAHNRAYQLQVDAEPQWHKL